MLKVITEEMKNEICEYYQQKPMTISDLGSHFNLSNPTIIKILDERHITRYKKSRIFSPMLEESFFSSIDAEEKAYYLGLIVSDGNIFLPKSGNKQPSVSITLQDGDSYLLELFAKTIHSNNRITRDGRGASMVAVHSNIMTNDLCALGVSERKSFSAKMPEIPNGMMFHFLRGLLDGDGSVQARQTDVKNRYKHSVGICGTEDLMISVRDYLVSELHITNVKVYSYKNRLLSMVTWAGIDDIETLYHYLYDGATIFMRRKRDKFEDILRHYDRM